MTLLRDKYLEWYGAARCEASCLLTDALTAAQMYGGTTRPDMWVASLAHTNQAEARRVVVLLLQNAGALLDAGDLKTQIASLNHTDDSATVATHCQWARARRKAHQREGHRLEHAFQNVVEYMAGIQDPPPVGAEAEYFRLQRPKMVLPSLEAVLQYRMAKESITLEVARAAMYVTLRAEISQVVWTTDDRTAEVYA